MTEAGRQDDVSTSVVVGGREGMAEILRRSAATYRDAITRMELALTALLEGKPDEFEEFARELADDANAVGTPDGHRWAFNLRTRQALEVACER
jgi:hypothetical protein